MVRRIFEIRNHYLRYKDSRTFSIEMIETIKHLIREKSNLYDFKYISPDQIDEFSNGIKDMHVRNFDGMIIKGFLSPSEIESIKKGFSGLPHDEFVHIREGRAYPPVFAQLLRNVVGKPDDVKNIGKFTEYFDKCEAFRESFKEKFGVDFRHKIDDVFSRMGRGRSVDVPKGFNGQGRYTFCTIRCLIPETGEMSVHTGNYFRESCAEFYEHLETQVKTYDQLSFFVTLQKAEAGGGLTLYDIEWKDGQTKDNPSENRYVRDVDGKLIDIQGLGRKTMTLTPEAGDLLIFNGAQIWHRVEIVKGKRDRMTIGGFIGFSEDDKEILYWS